MDASEAASMGGALVDAGIGALDATSEPGIARERALSQAADAILKPK